LSGEAGGRETRPLFAASIEAPTKPVDSPPLLLYRNSALNKADLDPVSNRRRPSRHSKVAFC
jgi:hypothetical protein